MAQTVYYPGVQQIKGIKAHVFQPYVVVTAREVRYLCSVRYIRDFKRILWIKRRDAFSQLTLIRSDRREEYGDLLLCFVSKMLDFATEEPPTRLGRFWM